MSDQFPRDGRSRPTAHRPGPADPAPDGFDDDAPLRRRGPVAPRGRRGLTRGLRFAGLGALTVGIVMGVYVSGLGTQPTASSGMPAGHPAVTSSPTPEPSPTVDQAQAAALRAKVAADPADTASLKALADLYAAAGQWGEAADWQGRLVDLNRSDTDNRLILGVYQFNDSDLAGAEAQWLEVVRLDPEKVEAYYDLGFLYLAKSPPEADKTERMWQRVIDIAPDSAIAQTVTRHLSALSGSTAAPSASPSNG
nr:hypothetical protein [Propionibacterium sp.]